MKLLHRTRKPILLYATAVLFLSIPAYYIILQKVWLADIDEDLVVVKRKVERGLQGGHLPQEALAEAIQRINALEAGVHLALLPPDSSVHEHFGTVVRYDDLHGHAEPFRTYTSSLALNGVPYAITISRVVEETEALVLAITLVALVSLVLLFGGTLLIDRVAARRIWRPFHRLLEALKRFHVDSDASFQASPTGITEFDELERVVEQLTQRNKAIYEEQRRFTENAAHELRTPLALLQGKVERLFQTKGLTEEQAGLLDEAGRLLGRMRRTHDGLLLLARVDNAPVRAEDRCDPGSIIRAQLALAQERIDTLDLTVSVEAEQLVSWRMEPSMAEILLGNLIGNAIRHNKRGGRIHITLAPDMLTIANTGDGGALDLEALFKRFSGSGDSKGLGLGLAIAQRVCARQGWSLRYAYQEDMHTFSVHPAPGG
ncbi:MAG: HAMP domain-containing histidine kinase [Flavobacteriales bacterium]|nr:HAMP domain-containing histidine kinase [Flavobacteriales bacterium]